VTYQTDANGQPVTKILVESLTDIANELYLGSVVDRGSRKIVFIASSEVWCGDRKGCRGNTRVNT